MKTLAEVAVICLTILCLSSCTRHQASEASVAVAPQKPVPVGKVVWPEGKRAAVSLTFDDARASQVDAGLPLFDSYGVRATFYVSMASVPQRRAEWQAVAKTRHEIGNHSLRHPCTGNFPFSKGKALEDYTLAQIATELDQANAEIEKLLGIHPVTYAYPCGQKFVGRGTEARSYVPVVAERFLAGRGWRDEAPNDPAYCDLAQLMTMELDGLTWEQLKVLVDQTIEGGFWLVLCGHEIGEGGRRQMVRTDTLRAFCEYAKDPKNGLWVDTVANIGRYIQEQRSGSVAATR